MVEIIGIFASLIIVFSMSFKSDNIKGNIKMRVINAIGSFLFCIYGALLPAYSTLFLNIIMVFINITYIFKLIKQLNVSS